MSDTDTEFDFDAPEANEAPVSNSSNSSDDDTPKQEAKKRGRKPGKREKHPLPPDWETPSDLAIRVNFEGTLGQDEEGNNREIEGTTLYAYAKNRSRDAEVTGDPESVGDFPSKSHTDGRLICEIAPAMEWLSNKAEEMANRDRLRAERAANRGAVRMRSYTKAIALMAKEAS